MTEPIPPVPDVVESMFRDCGQVLDVVDATLAAPDDRYAAAVEAMGQVDQWGPQHIVAAVVLVSTIAEMADINLAGLRALIEVKSDTELDAILSGLGDLTDPRSAEQGGGHE